MQIIKVVMAWVALTGFFALYIILMDIIRPLALIIEYYLAKI